MYLWQLTFFEFEFKFKFGHVAQDSDIKNTKAVSSHVNVG